jgi:uncharacterized membrane protein
MTNDPLQRSPDDVARPAVRVWTLKRNCSMAPHTLAWVFGSLAAVSGVIAAMFWMLGAPLVSAFAGIETAALATAFVVFGRHVGDGEQVVLQPGELVVERIRAGSVHTQRLNPAWVNVRVEQVSGVGPLSSRTRVALAQHGEVVEVGCLVSDERRRLFVRELRGALASV